MAANVSYQYHSLYNNGLSFLKSMSLKCTLELGIPEAMHKHGSPITVTQLSAALSIPPSKTPALRTMMRLFTHSAPIFTVTNQNSKEEEAYALNSVSNLLLTSEPRSMSQLITLILHQTSVTPLAHLAPWLRTSGEGTALKMIHGMELFELAAADKELNELFSSGLASDAQFMLDAFLVQESGRRLFEGVRSLVDVGGGTGMMAKAVSEAFPEVKCMVLDLPHVVGTVKDWGGVEFVVGDMFVEVPPADVVLLKWILHDWSDEHCIEILKNCRDVIPSREKGRKVIIVKMVVAVTTPDYSIPIETQLIVDLVMSSKTTGKERNEDEWCNVFKAAGFDEYKISPCLGLRSIIELTYI